MKLLGKLFKGKPSIYGRKSVSSQTISLITSDWQTVNNALNSGSPSQLRQALMIADKALDNALRDIVKGETMGERLKNAKDKFDYGTYDKIWKAHKMRNELVHEAGFDPQHHMVVKAVNDLKKGLSKLGVKI